MNNAYATQSNPSGKYAEGTRIEISGSSVKADNGTFEVGAPFPCQTNTGNAYYTLYRVTRAGERSTSRSTNNLRGAWAASLDRKAKIISAPVSK